MVLKKEEDTLMPARDIMSDIMSARTRCCSEHCPSQYTQNICITFIQRRPEVFDVGPTLYTFYTNGLCKLGWISGPDFCVFQDNFRELSM